MFETTGASAAKLNAADVDKIYRRIVDNVTTLIKENTSKSGGDEKVNGFYDTVALFYGTPYHIQYSFKEERGIGGKMTEANLKVMHIPSETVILNIQSRIE